MKDDYFSIFVAGEGQWGSGREGKGLLFSEGGKNVIGKDRGGGEGSLKVPYEALVRGICSKKKKSSSLNKRGGHRPGGRTCALLGLGVCFQPSVQTGRGPAAGKKVLSIFRKKGSSLGGKEGR